MSWQLYDPDDPDAPQDIDIDDDDDNVTLEVTDCPGCGRTVLEDAPRCPHCGQWIFGDTTAGRRARGWFWPVMVALLVAIILVFWHGLGR